MPTDTFGLSVSVAEAYERQKVKVVFGPLAEATVARQSISSDDRVLDVACGTGIVARTVRRMFGSGPEVVASDLSAAMIETARRVAALEGAGIEFHIGDASGLPFDDDAFDFVFCQQGIQFMPDENAALHEWCRVLGPGGKLLISAWAGASPLFRALGEALRQHVDAAVAERSLAPFAWSGLDSLPRRLEDLGFESIDVSEVVVDRRLDEPKAELNDEIRANPVGAAVLDRGTGVLDAVISDTLAALAKFEVGSAVVVPQRSHLFTAVWSG